MKEVSHIEITIVEGARGTGKSTIAFKLRQRIPETTLINFTGFHTDGEDGLDKVSKYYYRWMNFLYSMRFHDSKFVFDRFYFSEAVYTPLYKEYDFNNSYRILNEMLFALTEDVEINIFFLTIHDKEELKQRLIRDKVPFGKAEESVEQTLIQQDMYSKLFNELKNKNNNLNIYTINTSYMTNDEVYDEIIKLKTTN